MRRRHFSNLGHRSRFAKPRTKKIRNPIRIKERIAKKGGKCAACRLRYEPGAEITVVNIRRRVYHRHGCVPANVGQMPTTGGPVISSTPTAVVQALSANWSPGEAKLVGMLALENALVVLAKFELTKHPKLPPEMEAAFDRYEKLKASALRPGSENEGLMAMREAVIKLVRTVF